MGRKFKVGDKVVFTKKAIESSMFHESIQVGDLAVVKSIESCVGGSFPTNVLPERDGLWVQCVDMDYEPEVYEWFEHADAKKGHKKKKQRKHFRMGDFVALKDGVNPGEVLGFGDMPLDAVGVVCGNGDAVSVEVHYGSGITEYDRVQPEALRLATKEERKALRKRKVTKITYDDVVTEEIKQDTETVEAKIPPEYDVKVGDIVEVTKHSCGHSVGAIVKVVEVRPLGYFSEYNTVRAVGFDGREWSEDDVKLVHRAMSICEDEDNSEPNSAVAPATEEEKMIMCDDKIVSHTGSVYHVHDIDTSVSPSTYRISVEKESSWTELVNYYAKLLEDGRVYDWATDTTFANVESWIKTTK